MRLTHSQDLRISDICAEFPLKAIEDDGSYRAAIEVLDRLFVLDHTKSVAELEYFQTLAKLAYRYELKHSSSSAHAPLGRGRWRRR